MIYPCKDCNRENKRLGCHDNCKEYQQLKKERDAANDKMRKEGQLDYQCIAK